jgi:hypothetical protein
MKNRDVLSVIAEAEMAGIEIRPWGDKLRLTVPRQAPRELIAKLRTHKRAILDYLAERVTSFEAEGPPVFEAASWQEVKEILADFFARREAVRAIKRH